MQASPSVSIENFRLSDIETGYSFLRFLEEISGNGSGSSAEKKAGPATKNSIVAGEKGTDREENCAFENPDSHLRGKKQALEDGALFNSWNILAQAAARETILPELDLATSEQVQPAGSKDAAAHAPRSQERYLTGVEIAFAALVAVSGMVPFSKEGHTEDVSTESESSEDTNSVKRTSIKLLPRKTHVVSGSETLQDIAEKTYRNCNVAWLIADINSASLKEEWIDGKRVVELRLRQRLELPEPEEAALFLGRLRKDFQISRLITVITENIIDRRTMDLLLGPVTGCLSRPCLLPN
jgi:hypothetical protein